MPDSIYATPEAEIAPPPGTGPRYYVVSPKKFLLLTILTSGLYTAYWSYRNWRHIKVVDNNSTWPVARGLFSIFFVHSLLSDVNRNLQSTGNDYEWNPQLIATSFVVVAIISTLVGQLGGYVSIPPWLYLALLATPVLYGLILLQGQKGINAASDDAGGHGNSKLTAANWIWMILGALILVGNFYFAYLILLNPGLLQP